MITFINSTFNNVYLNYINGFTSVSAMIPKFIKKTIKINIITAIWLTSPWKYWELKSGETEWIWENNSGSKELRHQNDLLVFTELLNLLNWTTQLIVCYIIVFFWYIYWSLFILPKVNQEILNKKRNHQKLYQLIACLFSCIY